LKLCREQSKTKRNVEATPSKNINNQTTANSTPEKDEQIVIDHFNNILEEPEKRFIKSK
jgi:hypothetical protein